MTFNILAIFFFLFEFRTLASFNSTNDVSSLLRGKVYDSTRRNYMLHRSETWSLRRENELALHQTEMRVIR